MALSVPVPGLRRMVNPSHDVAKVSLVVPAGEEVEASEYVAGQLERQGFKAAEPKAYDTTPLVATPAVEDEAPKAKKKA